MNSIGVRQPKTDEVDSTDRASLTPLRPLTATDSTPPAPDDSQQRAAHDRAPRQRPTLSQLKKRLSESGWSVPLCWMIPAFLLRLFLVCGFEQVISPDGVQYVSLGRALMAGNFRAGLSPYWPPLYPLLTGLSSLVFHDPEFAGRFVSVVAGSLLVIPCYRLMRNWHGERAAVVGASLIALHPLLIYYSTVLLTESTYTLLFTCGVLAGWTALSSGRSRAFLLAGLTLGACYLLKPEAAGFLLLLLVPTLCRKLFDKSSSFKTCARNALLLCAGFLLLATPYVLYLRAQTGAWTLSGKMAAHLWQGSRLAGGELAPTLNPLLPGMTTVVVQLTKALRFEHEIFSLIFPPTFVLLAALGLFRKRWTKGRARRELYLFSFVAATLLGYSVTLPNIRFIVPLLPILLCWSAKGVVEFAEWANETLAGAGGASRLLLPLRKIIAPLIIAGLLASLLPLSVYLLRGDKWSDYYGQKRAAAWIKEQDAASAPVIMSTVPIAAFYAKGRHVELVDEEYATLIARARREGVRYLIVNERDFRYLSLRPLLDGNIIHPGLSLVHAIGEAPGHAILVYAVDEQRPGATQKVESP
ncbi:MAG TPA: glycosyltransferase family 39 protein [Pyrinomonadaceae bacterium]